MPGPYRQSDDTPAAPLHQLEWRRRVAGSARWAHLFLAGEAVLLVATGLLPARFAIPGAVAWFLLGAGAAVAAWRLTAGRPGGRVHWRAWLVRASVPAYFGVTGLLMLGLAWGGTSCVTGALLMGAAIGFAWPLVTSRPRPKHHWTPLQWALVFACYGVLLPTVDYLTSHFLPELHPWALWRLMGLNVVLVAAVAPWALRNTLVPTDHQWWFDNQTGTPGEWVALLVFRDKQAQVLRIGKEPGSFASEEKAVEWLDENGYVLAERALAEHLVERVPPDVLPLTRRRERLRVERSEPRVRIEDETRDGVVDELDETAAADRLDALEPPRTLTVEKPHDH